jgi:hypothetical protein
MEIRSQTFESGEGLNVKSGKKNPQVFNFRDALVDEAPFYG